MRFTTVRSHFRGWQIVSIQDLRKLDPNFDVRRLVEWQQKGYIKKLVRNCFVFADISLNEQALFVIANAICTPSYISLETGLAYYQLIPESVYAVTSVTTRKTIKFHTPTGDFDYRSIKPELFFGYTAIPYFGQRYRLARMEKAVLDFLYINPHLQTGEDFSGFRINTRELLVNLDQRRWEQYVAAFGSRALAERAKTFREFISHDGF